MSCGSDAAVAEGFLQVESVTGVQILRQGRPAHSHHTGVHPLLEPTMTCLVGRIVLWQIGPWSASAQDEEDAIEHLTPNQVKGVHGRPCGDWAQGLAGSARPTGLP